MPGPTCLNPKYRPPLTRARICNILPEADKSTDPGTVGGTETPEHSSFAIHLASHKTKDAATTEWLQLKAKYPELFGEKQLALQTVDLEDRGTFVRVLAEPLMTSQGRRTFAPSFALTGNIFRWLSNLEVMRLNQ